MISNKWNRVFTQCSIFLALSPYNWNRVITRSSIYLASVALFVRLLSYFLLSLPYHGSYRLIQAAITSLWQIITLSQLLHVIYLAIIIGNPS